MPVSNSVLDYSNTIIYKITCKDTSVKDLYVGHTTNFVQRKRAHKQSCINPKTINHNCKLYSIIRENGGWTNWIMEIVHFFNCNDQYEARTKEQEYFILLKATLNSVEPMPTPKPKPEPLVKIVPIISNSHKTYHCDICDFLSSNRKDYNRHVRTSKHIKRTNLKHDAQKTAEQFICGKCKKCYKERTGLWRHNQTCKSVVDTNNHFVIDKEFVMSILKQNSDIIKENSELTNQLLEKQKSTQQIMLEIIKAQNLSVSSK